MENTFYIIASVIAFLSAITVHEASHAWAANKLGDTTARLGGRISLNPLVHLDPVGTILIPLTLIFLRSPFVFGWAKPVTFNIFNLKNPRRGVALISLAGPVANIILAISISLVLQAGGIFFKQNSFITLLAFLTLQINIVLAIFNLIPIHPLDGGKIFVSLLPEKDAREADEFLSKYGMIILFFLIAPIFNGRSAIFSFISPIVGFILNILLPG